MTKDALFGEETTTNLGLPSSHPNYLRALQCAAHLSVHDLTFKTKRISLSKKIWQGVLYVAGNFEKEKETLSNIFKCPCCKSIVVKTLDEAVEHCQSGSGGNPIVTGGTLYSIVPPLYGEELCLFRASIWLLRCFLEFCTALSTNTPDTDGTTTQNRPAK